MSDVWGQRKYDNDIIYCDVDGVLLLWPGGKPGSTKYAKQKGLAPVANMKVAVYLVQKKLEGAKIVLWSAGGAEHAKFAMEFCKLQDIVDVCLMKPSIIIDDNHKWFGKRKLRDENLQEIQL